MYKGYISSLERERMASDIILFLKKNRLTYSWLQCRVQERLGLRFGRDVVRKSILQFRSEQADDIIVASAAIIKQYEKCFCGGARK